ncbi:MAG: response regulator [Betaproteobacteria bacterium]
MDSAIRTTVFIVEDSPSIRDRLVEMLGALDVELVGDAETPDDAIAGILRTRPVYVVLDYQLNGGTAVDVLRVVHPQAPTTIFIVLTNHANPQYRRICLDAGASYFFDKSLEFGKVRDVIAATVAAQT